ncbi:MAG: hypothetical protein E7594_00390 [Ruminococcaceae bacterium]|nr:hypothetical protein [Oscillospiraceae bacterium]
MNKAMIRVTVILTAVATLLCSLGLFVLGVLTAAFHYGMMDTTVHFSFILIGLALTVCSLPLCIYRIKQGNRLIDAIADPITGVFLIFLGLGCELLQHLFFDSFGTKFTAVELCIVILRGIVGLGAVCYLSVLPILRMRAAPGRALQYRVEMHKPVYGAVILISLLSHLWIALLDPPSVPGYAMLAVSLFMAVFAIVHLIVGLKGLSEACKAAESDHL